MCFIYFREVQEVNIKGDKALVYIVQADQHLTHLNEINWSMKVIIIICVHIIITYLITMKVKKCVGVIHELPHATNLSVMYSTKCYTHTHYNRSLSSHPSRS